MKKQFSFQYALQIDLYHPTTHHFYLKPFPFKFQYFEGYLAKNEVTGYQIVLALQNVFGANLILKLGLLKIIQYNLKYTRIKVLIINSYIHLKHTPNPQLILKT